MKINLSFNIPDSIFGRFEDAKNFVRKWVYKLNPDRCIRCNAKMYVRVYNIEHTVNNQRVMVGNHKACVCRSCLVELLEKEEWNPRFTNLFYGINPKKKYDVVSWKSKVCDVTKKKVPAFKDVEIFPYVDMTFCHTAWNHSHISKDVIIDVVKNGAITTGFFVYRNGKMGCTNHRRLYINRNGELI